MEGDAAPIRALGDGAYGRSKLKDVLGIGRPTPLKKDGAQLSVSDKDIGDVHV